jgi:hypothetical protein
MFLHPKPLSPGNPLLQRFQAIIFKFLNLAAPQTDQMIVVFPRHVVFKARGAVSKPAGGGPAALRQKTKGAVNRGESEARVLPLDPLIEFGDRHMRPGFPKGADDLIPLAGDLESPLPQKKVKSIFRQSFHGVSN